MSKNCFIYVRYSSDCNEECSRYLQAQIDSCSILAKRKKYKISRIFTENKSASMPDKRPVFNEMVESIKNKDVSCLIAYSLDRLVRNEIDLIKLSHLIETGALKQIITIDKEPFHGLYPLLSKHGKKRKSIQIVRAPFSFNKFMIYERDISGKFRHLKAQNRVSVSSSQQS